MTVRTSAISGVPTAPCSATAAFTNETSSGWQEVTFPAPVAVSANTTYIASYFAPEGHYALNTSYFNADVVTWPLRALASGASGGNGVYKYSASSAFPASISNASNYWVDVVFQLHAGRSHCSHACCPDTSSKRYRCGNGLEPDRYL